MKVSIIKESTQRHEVEIDSMYFIGQYDYSATRYYIKATDPSVIVEPFDGSSIGAIVIALKRSVLERGYHKVTPITEEEFNKELGKVINVAKGGKK